MGEFVLVFAASTEAAIAVSGSSAAASTRLLSFRTVAPGIDRLVITVQPSGVNGSQLTALIGNFLATQPVVRVVDAAGHGVPDVIVSRYHCLHSPRHVRVSLPL